MVLAVQGAVGNPKAREYLTPAAMSGVAGPGPATPPSYNYLPDLYLPPDPYSLGVPGVHRVDDSYIDGLGRSLIGTTQVLLPRSEPASSGTTSASGLPFSGSTRTTGQTLTAAHRKFLRAVSLAAPRREASISMT